MKYPIQWSFVKFKKRENIWFSKSLEIYSQFSLFTDLVFKNLNTHKNVFVTSKSMFTIFPQSPVDLTQGCKKT